MITYQTAVKMKELGFPQKRHKSAKYYVTPDMIIDFEDIHDFKEVTEWATKRSEVQVNWNDKFTYIPELIDLLGISTYDLTLDSAVYQWIEGRKGQPEKLVTRTEEALKDINPTPEPFKVERETFGQLKYDKKVHIDDSTIDGINKIKDAIQKTQNQPTS